MFHPMTGKPTKQKIHWYERHCYTPWGVDIRVACGNPGSASLIYCDNINDITCLKCMDVVTRPRKPTEL